MFRFFKRSAERKTAPVDLTHPDAVATIINTRVSEIPFGKNYRAYCAIREALFAPALIQTFDGNDILYKQPHDCYVNFLSAYPYTLWVGRKIELYERNCNVGTMIIEEIKNPLLDRNVKFVNNNDILDDYVVLNLALKRSLEWGKKYIIPLDVKLMKSIPDLSGTDIEKVARHVIQVRDDIIWGIYYQNWNVKTETLKIDAQKVTEEKYPWINKENLTSLNSQGMYYAWHG